MNVPGPNLFLPRCYTVIRHRLFRTLAGLDDPYDEAPAVLVSRQGVRRGTRNLGGGGNGGNGGNGSDDSAAGETFTYTVGRASSVIGGRTSVDGGADASSEDDHVVPGHRQGHGHSRNARAGRHGHGGAVTVGRRAVAASVMSESDEDEGPGRDGAGGLRRHHAAVTPARKRGAGGMLSRSRAVSGRSSEEGDVDRGDMGDERGDEGRQHDHHHLGNGHSRLHMPGHNLLSARRGTWAAFSRDCRRDSNVSIAGPAADFRSNSGRRTSNGGSGRRASGGEEDGVGGDGRSGKSRRRQGHHRSAHDASREDASAVSSRNGLGGGGPGRAGGEGLSSGILADEGDIPSPGSSTVSGLTGWREKRTQQRVASQRASQRAANDAARSGGEKHLARSRRDEGQEHEGDRDDNKGRASATAGIQEEDQERRSLRTQPAQGMERGAAAETSRSASSGRGAASTRSWNRKSGSGDVTVKALAAESELEREDEVEREPRQPRQGSSGHAESAGGEERQVSSSSKRTSGGAGTTSGIRGLSALSGTDASRSARDSGTTAEDQNRGLSFGDRVRSRSPKHSQRSAPISPRSSSTKAKGSSSVPTSTAPQTRVGAADRTRSASRNGSGKASGRSEAGRILPTVAGLPQRRAQSVPRRTADSSGTGARAEVEDGNSGGRGGGRGGNARGQRADADLEDGTHSRPATRTSDVLRGRRARDGGRSGDVRRSGALDRASSSRRAGI